MDQIHSYINSHDITSLRDYWSFLEQHLFSYLDAPYPVVIHRLVTNLFRIYLVNALQSGRNEKVTEFFEKMTPHLSSFPEWKDWYGEYDEMVDMRLMFRLFGKLTDWSWKLITELQVIFNYRLLFLLRFSICLRGSKGYLKYLWYASSFEWLRFSFLTCSGWVSLMTTYIMHKSLFYEIYPCQSVKVIIY